MTVVQFPADRRSSVVKRCADTLHRLHGEAANLFWRSEMIGFAAELRGHGMTEEEIARQAHLFMQAIQIELQSKFCEATDASALQSRS